jgi:ABC-type sugar transport system ATPase subunit
MVFQSYAIWPHMTVYDNVAFPLRHKRPRPSRAVLREKVLKALALVHLDGLEDRPAPYLSGGQQQRLARPPTSMASRGVRSSLVSSARPIFCLATSRPWSAPVTS